MNLSAYDNVKNKTNKFKTWLDSNKQLLLSRSIKYRPYYTFVKRFEPTLKTTVYFIVLLDCIPQNTVYFRTKKDDYGRLKFNVKTIFYESGLSEIQNDSNVDIIHIEHDSDGDIYKINI